MASNPPRFGPCPLSGNPGPTGNVPEKEEIMTRQQLIDHLASQNGMTKLAAKTSVAAVFECLADALASGNRVEIRGLGSFKVKSYKGFCGRNPKTAEIVQIPAKKLPVFRVGKSLKERVDV